MACGRATCACMGRWEKMGRWEDGRRWEDGKMGRWEDGKMGRWEDGKHRDIHMWSKGRARKLDADEGARRLRGCAPRVRLMRGKRGQGGAGGRGNSGGPVLQYSFRAVQARRHVTHTPRAHTKMERSDCAYRRGVVAYVRFAGSIAPGKPERLHGAFTARVGRSSNRGWSHMSASRGA